MGMENLIASRLVSDNVLMQFLNPWRHKLQKDYIDYMFLLHIFSGLYVFFQFYREERSIPGWICCMNTIATRLVTLKMC